MGVQGELYVVFVYMRHLDGYYVWMKTNEGVDMYAGKIPVWKACETSGLEYTCFAIGYVNHLST